MDDRDLGHNSCCSLLTACKSLVTISQHSRWGNLVKFCSLPGLLSLQDLNHVKIISFTIQYFLQFTVTHYLSPAVPGVVVVGGEIVRRTRGHVGLWDRSWGLQVVKPGHYCEFKNEAIFSCLRLFMWFLPSSNALIFCMKGPISLVAVIFSATSIDGERWAPSTKRFF